MSSITKYVSFSSIALILSIGVIIDAPSLPLATAAPEISLLPSNGDVGTTVNVKGSGFAPLSSIQIRFNEAAVDTNPSNVRANVLGRFDAKFDVPQSAAGSAVVTARETLLANSASSQFTVRNEEPVAEDLSVSTDENTNLEITLNATDANGDALTFAIVEDPEHGTLSNFDAESGTVTYEPNDNYDGSDAFKFKANDGHEDSNTANVSITVVPVNNPPTTEGQQLSVSENGELEITLTGSDPDGDELTFSITEGPESGTLDGDPPNVVYRASPGYHGSDSFAFVANDGETDSNVSRINITVVPVNDPPTATDVSVGINEDQSVTITLTATDTDSDQLNFVIVSRPSHGTLGPVTPVSSTSAIVTYNPEADYNGADSFTYRVDDGNASSNTATVNINIRPVNDAPVANSQNVSATAGERIEIILTGTDVDNDALSFHIAEGAKRGTLGPVAVASSTSATVSYTPGSNQNGFDSFTFRVSDGVAYSSPATVYVTIAPLSNAPASGNQASNTQGGGQSSGTASGGAGNSSGSGDAGAGGTNDNADSGANTPQEPAEIERSIGDEVQVQDNDNGIVAEGSDEVPVQENEGAPIQDNIPGQTALQSLATDTVGSSPFMSGPAAWLLPGVVAGLASVVAFLGYRERRLRKSNTTLQGRPPDSAEQIQGIKESTSNDQVKMLKLQDRITFMVYMNRIYRILDDEKGKTARERIFDAEYNRGRVSQTEFENSRSVVKNQFEQIGSILRSNLLLKDSFLESFGELTIKVWWAIKQEVHLDERRGRKWESLEWLGNEVEKYWSKRSSTSSQAS